MEQKPKDISELYFFTRQTLEPKGFAFMWVYKPMCPKCGKARIAKLKKRDKVYTCNECKSVFEKAEHDKLLNFNVEYTCPECSHKGELSGDWTSKPTSKTSAVMLKFNCQKCDNKLQISRMSKKKK